MRKIILFISVFALTITLYTTSLFAADAFSAHTVYFDANGGEYTHDPSEWVYLTSEYLADNLADYSVNYRLFDDTTQSYKTIDYLQTGTEGDAYAIVDGVYGSKITTPQTEDFEITGDIDISVKIAADNYSSSTEKSLVDHLGGSSGNRGYEFYLAATTSIPHFYWSPDGTTLINQQASIAPTVVDGEALWFRVTLDADNGASGYTLQFFTSSDGSTWSQLGNTITGGDVTSIFANDYQMTLGSRSGVSNLWSGKYYEAVVKDGIGTAGKVVASPNLGNIRTGYTSFEDVEGNIFTINGGVQVGFGAPELTILNASVSGKSVSYFSDDTNFENIFVLNPSLTFVSLGHNEGGSTDIQVAYSAMLAKINVDKASNFVLVAQNPKIAPATYITEHALRQQQVGVIASENGYGYIDAFEVINADTATYLNADGIHPVAAGSLAWESEAEKYLNGAFSIGNETYHIEVENNQLATLPTNPVNTGYDFGGWFTNDALTQEFNIDGDLIDTDTTLYAKWIIEDQTPISGATSFFTAPADTLALLGIAWYWYAAIVAVGIYYFGFTKSGKKSFKKFTK